MANRYKPRYKICYQLKNKVWINKNSKLRGFYNFRAPYAQNNKKIKLRKKLRSMKWVMISRFVTPRTRNKTNGRFIYKNIFQKKQQLKYFYGNLKEYQLQSLFRNNWKQQKSFKENIFISTLEKRLDMILYRSKLFPTIYACNQFISHQGIRINNNLVQNINYPLKYGDIITFDKKYWDLLYDRLNLKLIHRNSGHKLLKNYYYKQFLKFNKKSYQKKPFRNKFKLAHEIRKLKFRYMRLMRSIRYLTKQQIFTKKKIKLLQTIIYSQISPRISKINLLINSFKKYNNSDYQRFERQLIFLLLSSQKYINKFIYLYKLQKCIYLLKKLIAKNIHDNNYKDNKELKSILVKYNNYYTILNKSYKLRNIKLIILAKTLFLRGNLKKMIRFRKYLARKNKKIYNSKNNKRFSIFYKYPQWYIPNYLEIDYNTLQISFIYQTTNKEVLYPFFFSFNELTAFYRYKGF